VPPDEPAWWYRDDTTATAAMLAPVAALYGWLAEARHRRARPYRSPLPVLCVGNFTAGGTGKTPLVLHLCRRLRAAGRRPAVLTRGYGGRLAGPHRVAEGDGAGDVGDEALLLARAAPTVAARDRTAGVRAIEGMGEADVVVMDDGMQNPQPAKDLVIAMVDGGRGLGNGRVIPAGPLRAPLAFQLALAHAVVVNETKPGAGDAVAERLRRRFPGPLLRATTVAGADCAWLEGRRVVAWAGIGAPHRFFAMLEGLGADVAERIALRDHQRLVAADARRLLELARRQRATLVTTEKDMARLAGGAGVLAELAAAARTLPIALRFAPSDAERLDGLVAAALAARA
jgi:tetraacyldisaccharide 4'-kinase